MNYTYLHYRQAMTLLRGIGTISARRIIDALETEEHFFYLKESEIQHITGIQSSVVTNSEREKALEAADQILEQHSKRGVKSIYLKDEQFPQRLLHCPDGPIIIYQLGTADLNPKNSISVVGTRNNSRYGEAATRRVLEETKEITHQVVSGLAEGIDTIAHQEALRHNLSTVAVLGHGLDRIYPKSNEGLAKEILARGGALLSEFPLGVKPDRENFPKRNRIVAGMTDATIVIESSLKGGSLITARLAQDYNRDVFAVPGSIFNKNSMGCNALLANNGATPYLNGKQFSNEMGWSRNRKSVPQKSMPLAISDVQKRIFEFIQKHSPVSIDLLSLHLKMPISNLNVELLQLELKGVVNALPGCEYSV